MATTETRPTDAPGLDHEWVERRKFSVADYHRMGEVGILEYDAYRDELIDGDVFVRNPSKPPHAAGSMRLNALLSRRFSERAIISVVNPIRLDEYSEPLADLALLLRREDFYGKAHPNPRDVFLVIEIVYFSTDHDRGIKLPAYARSGVPEVWLVDLNQDCVEVHRNPEGGRYAVRSVVRRGESIAPEAFPDVPLSVDDIQGPYGPLRRRSSSPAGGPVMATVEKLSPSSVPAEADTTDATDIENGSATRWKFSVDDYYRMGEAGIFKDDERVELIDGDVYVMSPIGSRHGGTSKLLITVLSRAFFNRAIVSAADPVRLDDCSEPEPDLALVRLRPDYYRKSHPTAADVYFVVEIMDSSGAKDRRIKLPVYARSGVPEVWLIDVKQKRLDVYRKPEGSRYTVTLVARKGESVAPEAFPDVPLAVDAILG